MYIDELRQAQSDHAGWCLQDLFMCSRRRFLGAAGPLEIRSGTIDKLRDSATGALDFSPLADIYFVISERYIEKFSSPQELLFPSEADTPCVQWIRHIHQVLVPCLLCYDEFMRHVLRAIKAPPSRDRRTVGQDEAHLANGGAAL